MSWKFFINVIMYTILFIVYSILKIILLENKNKNRVELNNFFSQFHLERMREIFYLIILAKILENFI